MTRAAIYARFSTDQQRETSIEDQIRSCRQVAQAGGLEIVSEFTDRGISGGTSERPGYQDMLQYARRGHFSVILAEDISRLWRSRSEYGPRSAELEDLGVHIVTCVGDDTRKTGYGLVLDIKQAMAEHARKEISYRTRRGLEGRALAGTSTGSRCYGYRSVSAGKAPPVLAIDEEEAHVVRCIFQWCEAGVSMRSMASLLNEGGRPAPQGGRWGASTLASLLRNRRYLGAVIYGRTSVRTSAADSRRVARVMRPQPLVDRMDEGLRIISPELFERVQMRLTKSGASKVLAPDSPIPGSDTLRSPVART